MKYLDNQVKEDLSNGKGISRKNIIGITNLTSNSVTGQLLLDEKVLENVRLMVARIQKGNEFPNRVSIFSTISGEGVTSVSMSLGMVLAQDFEYKVCLVDLNWYSPSPVIDSTSNHKGVVELLREDLNTVSIDDYLNKVDGISFYVLPAGSLEESKRPIVARGKALPELLNRLETMFDVLILDVPAILSTSDAVHLAGLGKNGCMVIQQSVTSVHDIKTALEETKHLNILGVVINRVKLNTPEALIKLVAG